VSISSREGGRELQPCGARRKVLTTTSAVMSGTLPTATLRYAVFILPNITAFLNWESVVFSQWRRRVRHRQAAPEHDSLSHRRQPVVADTNV
jgi:hypothetical protein